MTSENPPTAEQLADAMKRLGYFVDIERSVCFGIVRWAARVSQDEQYNRYYEKTVESALEVAFRELCPSAMLVRAVIGGDGGGIILSLPKQSGSDTLTE